MGLNIILTLGTISNFYKGMNQKEKQETSKIFKIQDNELENILMKYILQSKHKGVIYINKFTILLWFNYTHLPI